MASAKIIELDDTNTCKICDNALAKYSCPRCNILYCSLICYQHQDHLDCSEDFYKTSLFESLNLSEDNPESKNKMMEILQRVHENNKINLDEDSLLSEEENDDDDEEDEDELDSDDNEDFDDIKTRLQGINLDNAEEVWEALTENERQEFVAFLRSEDVTKLIPSWEPWWYYTNKKKVEEVDDKEFQDAKSRCPVIIDIKDFSSLTKKSPADCIRYNLCNILASYAFTTRYFNGEHFDFAKEAISCWSSLSLHIKSKENFNDYDTAVKSVEQECINSEWILTDEENINIMREDLQKILEGPNMSEPTFYIFCALSDIHNLLNAAIHPADNTKESEFSKKFPDDHFPSVKIESVKNMENFSKKIDYYLSYVKDCYSPL